MLNKVRSLTIFYHARSQCYWGWRLTEHLAQTDLLKKKLQSGIVVKKYITSYGERPNRYEDVSEYFRAHFSQVHKRKGQSRQKLFVHFTSMLDVSATQKIIVDGTYTLRVVVECGLC